jgi:hypothetical protein
VPGVLATAWLAAWASSLFLPIIKVSKVYLGFRPEAPIEKVSFCPLWLSVGALIVFFALVFWETWG